MLKEFGGVAQLDGGALGEMGARFARSSRDTPADQQARRHHLAVGIFDKQVMVLPTQNLCISFWVLQAFEGDGGLLRTILPRYACRPAGQATPPGSRHLRQAGDGA